MNKIVSYLQEHLDGEVIDTAAIRQALSHDASVFEITPLMAVYPKNTNDIRKTMRFSWQLAERGHVLPITARGAGSDQTGAAIGKGVVMVFPAHMNRLLEIDTKQNLARLQPGLNYRTLEQTLATHSRSLPPEPASADYSTVGGAIANNAAGAASTKYGSMREFVDKLEVVLANGEVIQTGRLSRRELDKKKGETSFEAEIYRQLDGVIVDNWDTIQSADRVTSNSGYDLADVKRTDGSFDLTPLFVGSQGTLGIVSEAIVKLVPHSLTASLVVAEFESLENAHDALELLQPLKPARLELISGELVTFVRKHYPHQLKGLVDDETPAVVLLIEFDGLKPRAQKSHTKKAGKILSKLAARATKATDHDERERLWGIRKSARAFVNHQDGGKAAVPTLEGIGVPDEAFQQLFDETATLMKKHRLEYALWGSATNGSLNVRP